MSKKYNAKHRRAPSRYPAWLARRGETNVSVRMRDYVGVERVKRAGDKYAAKRTT